jgi:hypothetical protein
MHIGSFKGRCFNFIGKGGAYFVFLRPKIVSLLDTRGNKLLLSLGLKTNSRFLLSLTVFIL